MIVVVARNGTQTGVGTGGTETSKVGTDADGRNTNLVSLRAVGGGQSEDQRSRKRSPPPANPIPPTAARHRIGGAVHLPGVRDAATSKLRLTSGHLLKDLITHSTRTRSRNQRVPTAGIGDAAGSRPNANNIAQNCPRTERRHDNPIPLPATAARVIRLAGVVGLRKRATATVAVGPSEVITATVDPVGGCANSTIPTTATASCEGASHGPVSLPLPLSTIPNGGDVGYLARQVQRARNAIQTARAKAALNDLANASCRLALGGRG